MIQNKYTAFVCYAREGNDPAYRTKVRDFISRLEAHFLPQIRVQFDERIISPGQGIDQEIKNAINSSDIYLLIISADFFKSKYIQEIELDLIYQNKDQYREKCIFPILWLPVDLESHAFRRLGLVYSHNDNALSLYSRENLEILCGEIKRKLVAQIIGQPPYGHNQTVIGRAEKAPFVQTRSCITRGQMVSEYEKECKKGFRQTESAGKIIQPFVSFDLAFYRKHVSDELDLTLWLDAAYFETWNSFIASSYSPNQLAFNQRPQVQILPYIERNHIDLNAAIKEWTSIKLALHTMLCAGRSAIFRFGKLPNDLDGQGEFGVIQSSMFACTPEIHIDNFETKVVDVVCPEVTDAFDALNASVGEIITDAEDLDSQSIPIFYNWESLRTDELSLGYAQTVHRFLWRFQSGLCSRCTSLNPIAFERSRLVKIVANGNWCLTNLEVVCDAHSSTLRDAQNYKSYLTQILKVGTRVNGY